MNAADYFQGVTDAVEDAHKLNDAVQLMRAREGLHGVSYDRARVSGSRRVNPTDARIDFEKKIPGRIKADAKVIADALLLLYGADGKGGLSKAMSRKHADIVYLRHVKLLSWRKIAEQAGCPTSSARYYYRKAIEYIDAQGFARVRQA